MFDYDIIVIGGGHAGIEACMSTSKLNLKTLLITQTLDTIGRLSCNPAIGGLAKGNIVREIDALGGVMGILTDMSMIQFRLLNKSKGPSVRSPRAQADKIKYEHNAKIMLQNQKNLDLYQDIVVDLIVENNTVLGIRTELGVDITAKKVILTTGTFLNGKIFIGDFVKDSGRFGELNSYGLDKALRQSGHTIQRLKTGTPPRIHRDSIDFSVLEEQFGDSDIKPFSFSNLNVDFKSLSCHITYTNEKTHQIIRDGLGTSPLYSGKIIGNGPRYCPSIEDKVVKFAHHDRHQIFIEPETSDTKEMYLNGISTSLSYRVQNDIVHSIKGLENAKIMKYGYAVEYDAINPIDLFPTLESKYIKGLYIAGQTNGTSGYEEAASQGLMAGINASCSCLGYQDFILQRSDSYIGVLVDDLVTMGTKEPYRMFTSRAEHRVCLRYDNCDSRLTQKAYEIGMVEEDKYKNYIEKQSQISAVKELLKQSRISLDEIKKTDIDIKYANNTLSQLLKVPEISIEQFLETNGKLNQYPKEILKEVEIDVKYEGYIKRQEEQILSFKKMENIKIPNDIDYKSIFGLSNEAREKLSKIKPLSIGQASRINGIRQADVSILIMEVGRKTKNNELLDNSKIDKKDI